MTKTCNKCLKIKPLEEFKIQKATKDGRSCYCKECLKPIIRACMKKRYDKNREKLIKQVRDYQKNNIAKYKEYFKKYRQEHKTDIKIRRQKPKYKMIRNLSKRLGKIFKNLKINKTNFSYSKSVGCSSAKLKSYIESKFKPGMTWENHGKWHIDHIIPLSAFDLKNELTRPQANHYTNLQPLWAEENMSKSDSYTPIEYFI